MKSRPAFLAGVAAVAILASLGGTDASASHGARAGRIAFPMGTGNVDIYTVRPDGSDVKRLTTVRGFDGCPAYSPDGRKIASCSDRTGRYQIWLMKADGSDQRRLSTRLPALFPQFSPDG